MCICVDMYYNVIQAVMILVIISEKNQGIPSSGIQFSFWGALLVYAGIKLHTLILLSKDQVHISLLTNIFCSENYIFTYK